MKKRFFQILLVMLSTGILASCGSSGSNAGGTGSNINPADVDGGAANVSLSIKLAPQPVVAKSAEPTELQTTDGAGGTVALTEARAVVGKVELEMPDGANCTTVSISLTDAICDDTPEDIDESQTSSDSASMMKSEDAAETETGDGSDVENDEIEFKGPFVVDLLAGTVTPPLSDLVIPSGVYKEIKFKIQPLEQGSNLVAADDLLNGRSLVVKGTFDDGASVKTFILALKLDEEISFEDPAGFPVLESTAINDLIISLDVNKWFQNVGIGACLNSGSVTQDANGVYLITDETSGDACAFSDLIRAGIKDSGSAEIGEDNAQAESPDDSSADAEDGSGMEAESGTA